MRSSNQSAVTDIEIIEDFSSTAKCDEGFLRLRRLRCQNRRADGTASKGYRVDVVDRARLDAVAGGVDRRGAAGGGGGLRGGGAGRGGPGPARPPGGGGRPRGDCRSPRTRARRVCGIAR